MSVSKEQIEEIRAEWQRDLEVAAETPGLMGIEDPAEAVGLLLTALAERDAEIERLKSQLDESEETIVAQNIVADRLASVREAMLTEMRLTVKRYDLEITSSGYCSDHEMVARDDGEWCRFEDHEAELQSQLAASQAEVRRLRSMIDRSAVLLAVKSPSSLQPEAADFDPIHAICVTIRNKPCDLCPAQESSPYGDCTRGCRWQAEETANIARHGNPWGPDAPAESVEAWRARFNLP